MSGRTRLIVALLIPFTVMVLMFLMFNAPVTGSGMAYPESASPLQGLIVTKQASAAFVRAGDHLTYTLAVTNTEATTVMATIFDVLPPNVTVVGTSGDTVFLPGYITWPPVELAPGGVWTETVVVAVPAGYAGSLVNIVNASSSVGQASATAVVTAEVGIEGLAAFNDGPTQLGSLTTLTATLDAGSNVTYMWDFGDGGEYGEGAIVTHTYLHTGLFVARVTAINKVGFMRATTLVTITDIPITGLTVVNDSPTWIGAPTTLTATVATGSNVTYAWDFGDGEGGSGAVVTHVYPSVGTYTAVVTASNGANAVSDMSIVTITVAPVTGLTVVNDSPTLLGDPTTFTATVATGAGVTYTWDFGDGVSGSGVTVTHTYPNLGFYTATVTATNEFNAISATSLVTISDGSITGLAARNSSPTRIGSATQLTATVATGVDVAYVWDFGDGGTGSGPLVSHVYPSVGTYTVIVTASNKYNWMSATTLVTTTDVPVTRLSATNDGPTPLRQSTTFTANISTGTNVTYSWTFGDGEAGYGRVVSHTYRTGGTYMAIVTAKNSAGEWTASTQVKVAAYIYLPLVLRSWSPGPVTPTPPPTTPPPQDVYVLPNYSYYEVTGGPLYIVGEAHNNGSTYAVMVDVPVLLLDSSGNLLKSYKVYTSLDLPAGEKSCFHIAINYPPANWALIQFGTPAYSSFPNHPWPELVIYDHSGAHETDLTYRIVGSVRNDESTLITGVLIEGALYNTAGKIVGCHLVPPATPNLSAGQSSPFELFYGYADDYSNIATYRLQADGLVSK